MYLQVTFLGFSKLNHLLVTTLIHEVYEASDALVICLNRFFLECSNTEYIFDTNVEELTEDEVATFKEDCLLGVSVGLEVLGCLLFHTYNRDTNYFNEEQVSQLAQIDWSRENSLWRDNIARVDPKPKNPDKPYKLSTATNAVADAVKMVKIRLEWI